MTTICGDITCQSITIGNNGVIITSKNGNKFNLTSTQGPTTHYTKSINTNNNLLNLTDFDGSIVSYNSNEWSKRNKELKR